MTTIINELRDYEKVANTLRNKLDFLESQLSKEKALCERLQEHNTGRRDELNVLNKDNLKISYDIEEMIDKIKELKNPQSFFVTNDQNKNQQELSIAEKSLISNIKRGMNIVDKQHGNQLAINAYPNTHSAYTVAKLSHP